MKKVLFLFFLLFTSGIFAQALKPSDLVKVKNRNLSQKISLFSSSKNRTSRTALPSEVKDFNILNIDQALLKSIANGNEASFTLVIPKSERQNIELELVEVDLGSTVFRTSASDKPLDYKGGRHFRGIIKGNNSSIAAISVFENEVMGLISSTQEEGNLVLGKLSDGSRNSDYILYKDNEILSKLENHCQTKDSNEPYSREELKDNSSRNVGECVRLYIEVNNDIVVGKGGATNAINYITALYNQMAVLYANESISTTLSEVFTWTTTSPYNSPTTNGLLDQFAAAKNGFNGDLAMLVGYSGNGGIAYVNGLCSFSKDFSLGYSGIGTNFASVPTYSWSVNVLAHEFGHLFGSQHTHACVWNGNGTAIDGCGSIEGGCANPGLPSGGGTIMSYCHTKSVGINFSLGFGTQPGNLMRSVVSTASCLSGTCSSGGSPTCTDGVKNGQETGIDCGGPSCVPCAVLSTCTDGVKNGQETGIDCGGPTCAPCNTNCITGNLNLKLDNYPTETTWNIKNAANVQLYSGSGYSTPGANLNIPVCLPTGCYKFTINDAYGDGICCSYGNGLFNLVVNGVSVASGGQFTNTLVLDFCVNGVTTTPTCTDGVKNGQETGIDCGGPTCVPCAVLPTCTDGVKNGQETGIDCGGPICTPCAVLPTCTDGVKNGQETGIDCGGPTCTPCVVAPTCTDGVKNGQETGIDCGGPTCAPCNTNCITGNLNLKLDNYPTETTWNIKNAANVQLYSGSGYSTPGANLNIPVCLPTGCYKFTINDAYGDGICCTYGNGLFNLVVNGVSVASGGQFTNTLALDFCVNGVTSTPTCTDGVKNGQETGIDCGGPTCTPCAVLPTCTDGVKNGQETGIDCGGPTCTPCAVLPTCTDGVKNGQETGIDCGGPSCTPCAVLPTCTDGVKNGQETGIDCGGPTCAPCNTNCITGNLNLKLDNYPTETTWNIKNAANVQLYSGSGYSTPGANLNIPVCLPTGCYKFTINDAYGDGICCTYGNGLFNLVVNGVSVASGGQFTNTLALDFCVNGVTSAPTCTDGVKNGQETGIDCGGPSCAPCVSFPTCTDGIKNGQETGIDCGGPTCSPCSNGLLVGYYFENSNDGWSMNGPNAYNCNSCGAFEGVGNLVLQNNNSIATSPIIPSIQNYNSMRIEFAFKTQGMEIGKYFELQFSRDNGATWSELSTFASGFDFSNGSNVNVAINISTNFTNTTRLRFVSFGQDVSDKIFIDAIKISGQNNGFINGTQINTTSNFVKTNLTYKVYPNPASSFVNLEIPEEVVGEGELEVNIFDVLGKLVKKTSIDKSSRLHQIEVNDLNSGLFTLKMIDKNKSVFNGKLSIQK
jgi:hypothetical protein